MGNVKLMVKRMSVIEAMEIMEKNDTYLSDIEEFKKYYIVRDEENQEFLLIDKEKFNKFLFDNRQQLDEVFELLYVSYLYYKHTGRYFNFSFVPDFDYLIGEEVDNIINVLNKYKIRNFNGIITEYIDRLRFINIMRDADYIFISGVYFSRMRNNFDLTKINTYFFKTAYKDNLYYVYKPEMYYKKKYKVYIIVKSSFIKKMMEYQSEDMIFYLYDKFFK